MHWTDAMVVAVHGSLVLSCMGISYKSLTHPKHSSGCYFSELCMEWNSLDIE